MSFLDLFLIAVGLAMDAFAVSICKGLVMKKFDLKKCLIIGAYFGVFQGVMPIIGYFLGKNFEGIIVNIDHWIAFGLLLFIGLNMIKESFSDENDGTNDKVDFKTMLPLAVATSIDALAVGVTLAFLKINIWTSATTIAVVTFAISAIGVVIGKKAGKKLEKNAQILGGIILILIGIKILLQHLEII